MSVDYFCDILAEYDNIKNKYVTPRLAFYKESVDRKRHAAQFVRLTVLILSLCIPLITSVDRTLLPLSKEVIVAVMSLCIAFASGLEGIF
jgi:hypothetical protein